MGRKLDAFLGRNLRATKLRPLLNLAVSRLSILTNQRHARRSLAQSDVLQLLHLRHHHRALLRVEQVIKEQNALDAYVLIEGYLNLLIERISLIEQERECPVELKEAVSGLIFAASRCGDFPELHEIKSVFTARYGKEFIARAVELRNNCGVNHLFMQKLSTRQPHLESRMEVLKAICSDNGIELQLDESPPSNQVKLAGKVHDEVPSGRKQKYKDVADAAQAAFESAAEAAAAARAVMELSRTEHQGPGSGTSPRDEQEQKKPEVDSKQKSETEYRNRKEEVDEEEENSEVTTEEKNSMPAEENSEMDKQRPSNVEIGVDMETKLEKTEVTQKPSFRLNLEKKPVSVRTRRVRGF